MLDGIKLCVRACMSAWARACVCAYVRACVCAYVRACVCAYVRACVCAQVLNNDQTVPTYLIVYVTVYNLCLSMYML